MAFRNIFRHKWRLILNLILLVGAFISIVGLKGFKNHVLDTIQELVIDSQYGHLQIAKKNFWENSAVEQVTDKMIGNSEELMARIAKIEGVQYVSPRLSFYGLVNTQETSISARFVAINPEIERSVQKSILIFDGKEFKNSKETLVSTGMKSKLKVRSHDEITIVSPTLIGGINAMDLKVSGIFSSGFAEIDSGTAYLNIKDAHKILDSEFVDLLVVRLDYEKDIPSVKEKISSLLGLNDFQVKSWVELAELYNQVKTFYIFQNIFIEVIILLLLILSVANTVTMNVFERLSEIGTLRALGDYESDIRSLFITESFLMGILSIVIAVPLSFIAIHIISGIHFQVMLPLASQAMDIKIIPSWDSYLEASLVCLLSAVASSLWPAHKGSKISVVTALAAKI